MSVAAVSLDQALRVIKAGQQRAQRIGVAMDIVVVDSAGVLKAAQRMDGNSQASPTLAPLKAQTAERVPDGDARPACGGSRAIRRGWPRSRRRPGSRCSVAACRCAPAAG